MLERASTSYVTVRYSAAQMTCLALCEFCAPPARHTLIRQMTCLAPRKFCALSHVAVAVVAITAESRTLI